MKVYLRKKLSQFEIWPLIDAFVSSIVPCSDDDSLSDADDRVDTVQEEQLHSILENTSFQQYQTEQDITKTVVSTKKRSTKKANEKQVLLLWPLLGRSWPLGGPLAALEPLLGRSWLLLGRSWQLLGRSWPLFVRSLPLLARVLLGRSWGALGALLERSWLASAALGELLGNSWGARGRLRSTPGSC